MANDEILREFLLETHENLALLDSDLVKLESNPAEKSTLAQVFRTFHSVKGTAGFMGLTKLQTVAHAAESLLSRLRAGELAFTPPIATALLRVVDAFRDILANIEGTGAEGSGDYADVVAEVDRLRVGSQAHTTAAWDESPLPAPTFVGPTPAFSLRPIAQTGQPPPAIEAPPTDTKPPPEVEPAIASHDTTVDLSAPPLPVKAPVAPAQAVEQSPVATVAASATPAKAVGTQPVAPATPAAPPSAAPSAQAGSATASSGEPAEPRSSLAAETAIRVDVGLLDKLMTLVGELVLARNQILQHSAQRAEDHFAGAVQRLNLLTSELQASVMKTRMQPIGNVLNKLPRVVRDLSVACGKKVRLEIDGQDTELDKTLIEAIRDPLTHMIRNAVDHGIEPPATRRASGKSEEGRLRIVASHEGGKVVVEISDDGAGIDVAKVRDKALAAQLVTAEAVARMSATELQRLLFLPGFSTADRVTQFSGRGVGMDVVRTNVEKIGGTVEIDSVPGHGTTIRTKIPLTLAILPALIVVSGGERFAIPQSSLLELVRLEGRQARSGVERLHDAPVYRLRGALLPLVFLHEQLEQNGPRETADDLHIVVLQADERPFGLVVDAVGDTEEIVVKPLQRQLKGLPPFAGATIMGDGRVALVLDIVGLAQRSGVIAGGQGRALSEPEQVAPLREQEREPYLLFAPSGGGQMAIPLEHVARLEGISPASLADLGSQRVAQYRGEILPLVDVSRELDRLSGRQPAPAAPPPADALPVVVYAHGADRVGLVASAILDIVAEPTAARSQATRPGTLYTSLVHGTVTEFVDVPALIRSSRQAFPHSTD